VIKHVSDDVVGLCWCTACTKRLLKAHERSLNKWIEADRKAKK
jgi:hypothetical protein